MKLDAHYYGVLSFSRACGFKKEHAWDVAYASQYVDDAKINRISVIKAPNDEISQHMKLIRGVPTFFDMATCHAYSKIKTFNYSSMIGNTMAFHFVPGCEGNNFPKKLRCREKGGNSKIMDTLVSEAIEYGSPIRLGLVLHAYADTYSHQGFSGLLSKVNDIDDWRIEDGSGRIMDKLPVAARRLKNGFMRLMDEVVPAYGHAQALHYPDLPYLSWSFHYDQTDDFDEELRRSKVDNAVRFKSAFTGIKQILDEFLEKHPAYLDPSLPAVDFNPLFERLITKKSDRGRVRGWVKTMKATELFARDDPMLEYDETLWLRSAFANFSRRAFSQRSVADAILSDQFDRSKWFEYYKATRWYKERFFQLCKAAGIEIQR